MKEKGVDAVMEAHAKKILGEAFWIWPGNRLFDIRNTYAHFRKDFTLEQLPGEALLRITADQGYRLWINGEYAARGPARGYQSHWPYDEVDIRGYLKTGNNFLCVEVHNPGVSTFSYLFQSAAGLLCACDLGDVSIRSDASWRCRFDTAHKKETAHYSIQLGFQEHVDARKDDRRWITSPEAPEDWRKPELAAFGSMPWHALEERGIPLLRQKARQPERLVSTAAGSVIPGYAGWLNVAKELHIQLKEAVWQCAGGKPAPGPGFTVEQPAAGKGGYRAVILDMGETVVGPCSVTVDGGRSGGIVDLFYHERIGEQYGPFLPDPDALHSRISMANRLVLEEGRTQYDFYQILGFRYITLVLQENETPLHIGLSVLDTGYPYEIKGAFESSDPQWNDIWKICRRTQQVCSQDAYVDTPWREQAQWWGDARIQFWNTMAMDDDVRLFRRGIRSVAGQSAPNGLTYGHAPTKAHSCILPDFSLVWVMTLYDYYWQTGDVKLFEEQLPRVREVFSYFTKEAPRYKGLLSHDPRYWLFLDWSTLKTRGTPTLYNLWYLMALRTMAQLLELSGHPAEAEQYGKEAGELQAAIEKLLFNAERALFCDGLEDNGVPYENYSVQSQTFAVVLDLMPAYHANMLDERILPFLRGEKLEDPVPSTYWTSYVLMLAREKGYPGEALDYIKRMWTPMIPYSTCSEDFNHRGSVSHAWSAHPLFHLQNLLGGVVQADVAWSSIRFAPYFAPGVDDVRVKVPTPHGVIESRWERREGKIFVSLRLPERVKASVAIPGREGEVAGEFACVLEV